MTRIYRILFAAMVASTLLAGIVSYAGAESPRPDGTLSWSATLETSPSEGFGYTWGKGVLTLNDGTQQAFRAEGIGIRGSRGSVVDMEGTGQVYHLKSLQDFAGTYKGAQDDISIPGTEGNGRVFRLTNQHGVVLTLKPTTILETADVILTPSTSGVTVTLEQ